jgi:protein SCO1/2
VKITPLLASLSVLLIGGAIIYQGTDGLNALTAEQSRRYKALNNPSPVQPVSLMTQSGTQQSYFTAGEGAGEQKLMFVEFIFTKCLSVCITMGRSFHQLQEEVRRRNLTDKIAFVSISFDLERDHILALADFAEDHDADTDIWQVAKPNSQKDLQQLLKTFQVVVIEDPVFRYIHNAGLHIVSPDNRLVAILDAEDVQGGLDYIEAHL